jgi:hypothetical protein
MIISNDLATQNAFLVEENKRLRTERTELKREMKGMSIINRDSGFQSDHSNALIARLQDENQSFRSELRELNRQIAVIDSHIGRLGISFDDKTILSYNGLRMICEKLEHEAWNGS